MPLDFYESVARGFQRVGMSTVEAVNRKISWLFCFVSHGCTVSARSVLSIFAVREAGTVSLRGQKELWKELDELLRFYAWPTNLITLSAVVKRYGYLYRQAMNPSPGVKRQLLIKAIGEDELLEQLRQEYPALQDPAGSTPEAIVEGVAEMKRLLKYNDNTIADKLGFGRTTLWRMQKKSGAAKAKKEE